MIIVGAAARAGDLLETKKLVTPRESPPSSIRQAESASRTVCWKLKASPTAHAQVENSRVGLHWETLDEVISLADLLAGRGT